jgi:hypothetical protein
VSTTSLQKIVSDEINFSPKNLVRAFRSVDWPDLWDLFLINFLAGNVSFIFVPYYQGVDKFFKTLTKLALWQYFLLAKSETTCQKYRKGQ